MYQLTLNLSVPFDIVESMPRRCVRQTTRANPPSKHAKTVLESLIMFCVHRPHDNRTGVASDIIRKYGFYAHYLLPHVVGNTTNELISELFETYETGVAWHIICQIQSGGRSKANIVHVIF